MLSTIFKVLRVVLEVFMKCAWKLANKLPTLCPPLVCVCACGIDQVIKLYNKIGTLGGGGGGGGEEEDKDRSSFI